MIDRTSHRAATLPTANGKAAHQAEAESPAKPGAARPAIEPLLLSLDQAAGLLGLSPRSLKRADAEGALPPGAVVRPFGRRRLFNRVVLTKWIGDGCPAVRGGRRR